MKEIARTGSRITLLAVLSAITSGLYVLSPAVMAESSTVRSKVYFLCWEDGHMKNECQWLNYPCGVCEKAPMRLFQCRQGKNKGRGFLRCTTQPTCDAFEWLDELKQKLVVKGKDAVEDKGEDKVKLTVDGKMKLIFEGNVDDLCNIVKKLGLN